MKVRQSGGHRAGLAVLCAAGLVLGLTAGSAQAANAYFDVNGTAAGYGVANGGSYSWDGSNWASASGGTAAVHTWNAGDFARFSGGASGNAYTVTVNNAESMAGLYETVSGVSLTINAAGAGALDVVSGDQGFLVSGAASKVTINAPITGAGGVAPELSGSLYLYGHNTYSGGTTLGYSGAPLVYFNKNDSFGTGAIKLNTGLTAGSYFGLLGTGGATITLPNSFSSGSSGSGFNFAANADTPVVSTGNWNLGANDMLIRSSGGVAAPLTLAGVINGTAGVTFSANNNSAIILAGVNTYTGSTTVGVGGTAVTLKLGAANTIASSSEIIMAGGILEPGSLNQIMASTTLGLTADSTINFVDGAGEVDFANSSLVAWTGTLDLQGWILGTTKLRFGTDATGLTASQLAEIEFNGMGLGTGVLDANGYLVPEPATALLLLGASLLMVRRRRA